MQPALLIDEILRVILVFCLEDGSRTLGILARCCRAWKDPALDFLWMRLSSPAPLLHLISAVELVDGQYVLSHSPTPHDITCFRSYARRVKHITHCRHARIHGDVLYHLVDIDATPHNNYILPSLRTARVSSVCDPFQQVLTLSSQLHHLELDLGFKTRLSPPSIDHSCHFLEQVVRVAPDLKNLNIRGSASKNMNNLIASIQNLHTLSLRTGNSLTHKTMLAVAYFPFLSELDIHAGHLDVDSLASSLLDKLGPTFPSLRKLRVRAPATLIELFLNIIPTNTLQVLHIEAEDLADLSIAWSPIFRLISSKAANTLQSLTLEHHIELDDLDTNDSTSGDHITNTEGMNNKSDTQISFTTLKGLSPIRGLRRLILNTTLPPSISDHDMDTLVGWWPTLEHLDLGSASASGVGSTSSYPMTLRSLIVCAQKLPNLTSLIIPANANVACARTSAFLDDIQSHEKLVRITLGHPSSPNPVHLAKYLHRLFPLLIDVDGLYEHEEQWNHTRAALQACRSEDIS